MRLTQMAHGGGCACKIPPGELEEMVSGLEGIQDRRLLVGIEDGDDAAAISMTGDGCALLSTVDFFTPVVDDARDWGRIAATNALSDIYAMGGRPVVALNLLCWPREKLPLELAREVIAGAMDVTRTAGCPLAGGHSVDDPEPKYGMAVNGIADQNDLIRINGGRAGVPLSLTKPLGLGMLNARHKQTGEVFEEAVTIMTTLNRTASESAVANGIRGGTDVTGFGLLGHLHKLARASHVTAVINSGAIPLIEGACEAARAGFIPGGSRRNLAWVNPHVEWEVGADPIERLLLADAQTSGGLLLCGEIPGATVIGELVPRRGQTSIIVR